jgi:hypothetical protein
VDGDRELYRNGGFAFRDLADFQRTREANLSVSDCCHNHLLRLEDPTEGVEAALAEYGVRMRYQCQDCKDIVLVSLKPYGIKVCHGGAAPENT